MPENRWRKRAGEKGSWEDGGRGGEIEIERRKDGRKGEKRNRQRRKGWELVEERGERYGDTE